MTGRSVQTEQTNLKYLKLRIHENSNDDLEQTIVFDAAITDMSVRNSTETTHIMYETHA